MIIQLKSSSGLTETVKVGFSWTTLLFGWLVPLLRGDLKWAIIMFIVSNIARAYTLGTETFTLGPIASSSNGWTLMTSLIFSFIYNKL